jgi:hypothetical protein
MVASAECVRVLSLIPGRVRLHLPGSTTDDAQRIEDHLLRIKEVKSAQANPLTRNILIHFDHRTTDADTLLAKLNVVLGELPDDKRPASVGWSDTHVQANAGYSPVRVVVRGLLGHAVVDSLWFGAGFLGSAMGLPLAGLGPLHVLMDLAVWMTALAGEPGFISIPSEKQRAGQTAISQTDTFTRFERSDKP